jgi:hypothetical protein
VCAASPQCIGDVADAGSAAADHTRLRASSIIVANFAVWIFYELPHLRSSVLRHLTRL